MYTCKYIIWVCTKDAIGKQLVAHDIAVNNILKINAAYIKCQVVSVDPPSVTMDQQ